MPASAAAFKAYMCIKRHHLLVLDKTASPGQKRAARARGCAGAAAESRRRHRMLSPPSSKTRTTTRQTEHARAHERNPFAFGVLRSTSFFEWSCASDGDDKKGDGHMQTSSDGWVDGGWASGRERAHLQPELRK